MTDRSELRRTIDAAREHALPAWTDARGAQLAARVDARRRRRAVARVVSATGLVLAAAAASFWMVARGEVPAPVARAPEVVAPAPAVLRFADGSIATPLGDDTELFVDRMASDAIELSLVRGAARFAVTPGLPRAFRVRAGTVTVSVIGTEFTVTREGSGAIVEVDHGRVRIEWEHDGRDELSAGERGVYPRARVEAEPTAVRDEPAAARAPRVRTSRGRERAAEREVTPEPAPVTPDWRALAAEGRYDDGYALLLADTRVLRSDDVGTLVFAADCARLSGHPAESLPYLRRALEIGRDDERAPLVSFTLGRVLLQQLDRPAEAADAFAQARALAPEGSLAPDALAREVEASHRAGLAARARALAEEYLRRHPDGVRADAVRRFGGLE
ncbi:FecR family protein [Sandaracinus amylolyticus]|uniref:FecR family protein n=1 Tax=Sandaracinus amylolyticus TaxID=927083 RepID=UPI001F1A27A9|nr:FecR family protein [Sandaracinus amylolyticus]UJR83085.1 Hypothetical protein I5071_51510 [Sandaracinus amylolyticus]